MASGPQTRCCAPGPKARATAENYSRALLYLQAFNAVGREPHAGLERGHRRFLFPSQLDSDVARCDVFACDETEALAFFAGREEREARESQRAEVHGRH